jgi:hypothetical protein
VAGDGVWFSLQGVEAAQKALDELKADMRRSVVYGALRDGGKPIAKAAQALAQKHDFSSATRVAGTMRRAIGVRKSKRYKASNGVIGVYISVRATKAQRRRSPVSGDPFYYRFVVGGHARRQSKGKGARRSAPKVAARVEGDPFIGDAYRAEKENALRIFTERVFARIALANSKAKA